MASETITNMTPLLRSIRGRALGESFMEDNKMKETWNKIDGVHGEYFISNIGRVESRNLRRCFMKPTITPNWYLRVNLGFGGITQNRMIHRLVAMSFCKGYSEGKQVNHIDCNKFNNSPS